MRNRGLGWIMVWLVLVGAAQLAALTAVWRFSVRTWHGQLVDTAALTGNTIGQDTVAPVVSRTLDAMSVASLAAATAVIVLIALVRGRVLLALVAGGLIAGSNITSQLLKAQLYRPDFGVDPGREAVGNSFPSGHTTVAASVAVALVLVLPVRVRGVAGVAGAAYAALAGVATMSAGWHRPSDAVGAVLVVGCWAALAGLVLVVWQRREDVAEARRTNVFAAGCLGLAGLLASVVSFALLSWANSSLVDPPDDMGRRELFYAYAGSAAGITAAAAVVMAIVLATAHRVVPPRPAAVEAPLAAAAVAT
jgi:membrane-associated phospholipid phosphatase